MTSSAIALGAGLLASIVGGPALAGDGCGEATPIQPGVPVVVDTATATAGGDAVDPDQCPGTFLDWGDPTANPDVWLVWTAPEDGLATFSTCDAGGFDTSIVLYEGDCGDLQQVACNGDGVGETGCQSYYSRIEGHPVAAGTTCLLRIGGWQGTVGSTAISLEFLPFSSTCGPEGGACGEASATPGCGDASCCVSVCNVDPACCDSAWDDLCADAAISICDLYVPECPDDPAAPPNDCPTSPITVNGGDVLAFDTGLASTVGPAADCGSGKDDLQIHRDLWYRFAAPAAGVFVATTCNTADFDTKIAAYELPEGDFSPGDLPALPFACDDDGAGCGDFTSDLRVDVDGGDVLLVRLGGYFLQSGSGTIAFEFVPDAIACGDPAGGSCCVAGSGPHCAEGGCCESVCMFDPACCDASWDLLCADLALQICAPLCGTPLPPQTCESSGGDSAVSIANFEGVSGIGCQSGGVTTANTFAVVFTQAVLGERFAIECIDFGFENSGGYLEGQLVVSIDPDGGTPAAADLVDLASVPVGLYTGDDQVVTVAVETGCVELSEGRTLVVSLEVPQAALGFATFAGGAPGATTYLRSEACGFESFVPLDSIGHPDLGWWVRMSGAMGCGGGGTLGDLDGDGVVNGWDLNLLLAAWGGCSGCGADLDESGAVDGSDLAILLEAWASAAP